MTIEQDSLEVKPHITPADDLIPLLKQMLSLMENMESALEDVAASLQDIVDARSRW